MDSVQFKSATGFDYASSATPLPVIVVAPTGDQPNTWEWSTVSTATPLPCTTG